MAKKKGANAAALKAASGIKVQVVVDAFDGPSQYVNHAEIAHSSHEFILTFAQVSAKLSKSALAEMGNTHELIVEPSAQFMLPPTLIPLLINALSTQLQKYEQEFGKVNTRNK